MDQYEHENDYSAKIKQLKEEIEHEKVRHKEIRINYKMSLHLEREMRTKFVEVLDQN